jgi:hypothetical protein
MNGFEAKRPAFMRVPGKEVVALDGSAASRKTSVPQRAPAENNQEQGQCHRAKRTHLRSAH